ncbi:MAG: hypothetical protein DRQ02_04435 [Candidatus Latescibacterota bacterium]|nr:MAG: hypothetical protein DRQ02_04435 [Candidatus Latescibacterota bacterium]RKY71547.1 MAG: hypothetical protein DRQ24_07165 [Candidatus Latescibacterota bacterium]
MVPSQGDGPLASRLSNSGHSISVSSPVGGEKKGKIQGSAISSEFRDSQNKAGGFIVVTVGWKWA